MMAIRKESTKKPAHTTANNQPAPDFRLSSPTWMAYSFNSRPMQFIIYAYICIFALMAFVMCVGELLADPNERDPIWETVCDTAAAGVLLAGMVFFVVRADSQVLRMIWLILAPLAAGYVVFSSLSARKKEVLATKANIARTRFAFADVGTIMFVIPAFAINLIFATQRPITDQTTNANLVPVTDLERVSQRRA